MKKSLLSSMLIFLLLFSVKSFAGEEDGGGWSGNGGELSKQNDNVWFVGEKPVKYCIRSARDFRFDKKILESIVKESIKEWVSFFKKYKIDQKNFTRRNGIVAFPDERERKIALKFNEVTCPEGHDTILDDGIVFLFGEQNRVVKQYINIVSDGALGLAIRKKYNHKTYRNPGFIWVSDFTEDVLRLKHMVLHELGHMFGMKHDSTFVMSSNIAYQVSNKKWFDSSFFGRIESEFWKYRILPDDEILISSVKGRRRLRLLASLETSASPNLCSVNTYLPNKFLPRYVIKHFKLDINDCHQIVFKLLSNNKSRPHGITKFLLTIKQLNTYKIFELHGLMKRESKKSSSKMSPGLFTKWMIKENSSNNTPKYRWKWIPLDYDKSVMPQQGYFKFNGQTFPAKMKNDKGPVIEMFLPNKRKWWRLQAIRNGA